MNISSDNLTHIAEPLRHLAVPVESLTLDPANARKHDQRNLDPIKGRRGTGTRPRRGQTVACQCCGTTFYRRPCEENRRFCSLKCANTSRRRHPRFVRTCPSCFKSFETPLRPRSNSVGRYCSFECRNKGYLGKYHGKPAYGCASHRRGWARIRKRHIAANNDFCVACGTRSGRRLQVHHIEPYRLSANNDSGNLVTACTKCHARLERISERIAAMPPSLRPVAVAVVAAHLEDRWCVFQGRRLRSRGAA
jgi:heterodisulfide reductase subunit B